MAKGRRSESETKNNRVSRRADRRAGNFEIEEVRPVLRERSKKPLSARTEMQGHFISNILSKDIIFATGPAGTGKTYIAAALAAEELAAGRIDQIIITRPMQECGEEMGFLPGELHDKYEPWVEPVLNVLNERLGKSYVENLRKNQKIVAKPLQYMRGMSFTDCWIIMDEAQNVTPDQMKMFLTRLGANSKMIIDGDINQTDLKTYRGEKVESGLARAIKNLSKIPQIGFVEFSMDDIVRHGLIRDILINF